MGSFLFNFATVEKNLFGASKLNSFFVSTTDFVFDVDDDSTTNDDSIDDENDKVTSDEEQVKRGHSLTTSRKFGLFLTTLSPSVTLLCPKPYVCYRSSCSSNSS